MKRSEINAALAWAEDVAAKYGAVLPAYAYFRPDDWKAQDRSEWAEVIDCELGWDVTDFGEGDFATTGLTLFTLRNGLGVPSYPKPYSEKILFIHEEQATPIHFHDHKMEDIICRGGDLLIRLNLATPDGELDEDSDVVLSVDGRRTVVPAGGYLHLKTGQSTTIAPRIYHTFWAEAAPVLGWEVATINDDHTGLRFLVPTPRFPIVEDDEAPRRALCHEYDRFLPLAGGTGPV